jgi:PAS domain S-box-containing protein
MLSPPVVLNVDDTAETRYNKTRILRHAGYEVVECTTGGEALRLLRELPPDVVLLDVRLPDMSGLAVCRRIKEDPATAYLPVIQISSTFLTERDEAEALKHGADIYLTEPLEPKELETVTGVLLRLSRTEAGLRENERRWKRLTASNAVGVVIVEGGSIVEANERYLQMIGRTTADVGAGRLSIEQITAPAYAEATRRAIGEVLEQGADAAFESGYLCPDGSLVSVVVSATLLDARRGRWMALVLDMSDRKRLEAERQESLERERVARSQAEKATALKDEFIANVSHELRTPMNIIVGWAHLLKTAALDEAQRQRAAEAIGRAARAQAQLIEDLLDMSRMATGKFTVQMAPVDIAETVRNAADGLRLTAQEKKVALNVSITSGGAQVLGDADRLQQVLWNLLSNAVKFTPSGGRVEVRLVREGGSVCITVADSGVGIDREFLPYVFDRFRQADSSSTRQHTGMGLGLAIVQHMVALHGGSVRAESEGLGRGATFAVRLPVLTPEAAEQAAAQSQEARAEPSLRVLLVEDDSDTREIIAAGLERVGFEVRSVSSAAQALELLDSWLPDALVSDIGMPNVDGYELIRQVRARPHERGGKIPALALTAFARTEDAARAYACGYQIHLPKPVDPGALKIALLNVSRPPGS